MDCRMLLALVLAAACTASRPAAPPLGNTPTPLPPELAAIEAGGQRRLDHVIVATSGVYVNRKRILELQQLAASGDELDLALRGISLAPRRLQVMFVVPGASAALFHDALRRIARTHPTLEVSDASGGPEQVHLICRSLVAEREASPDRPVALSVFLEVARAWIGLSRVNEFQEFPQLEGMLDREKLVLALRQHKDSAFFVDRKAAELAIDPGVAGDDYLHALQALCEVGFVKLALVTPSELSARIRL